MKFNKYLRPALISAIELEREQEILRRSGQQGTALLEAIKPHLDGHHLTSEIYAKLNIADFNPRSICQTFEALDSLGLLAEGAAGDGTLLSQDALQRHARQIELFDSWWHLASPSTGPQSKGCEAQAKLISSRVLIVGLENAGAKLAQNLAAAGVGTIVGIGASAFGTEGTHHKNGKSLTGTISAINPATRFSEITSAEELPESLNDEAPPSLLVYCPDDFDTGLCVLLNRLSLTTPVPLLIYRQTSNHVEIGPLIIPGQTACYICCDLRRQVALGAPTIDDICVGLPSGLNFSVGVDLLALEVVKILTQVALPVSRGKIWRMDLKTGMSEVHPILKLPRCVACGVHRKAPFRKLWEYTPPPRAKAV